MAKAAKKAPKTGSLMDRLRKASTLEYSDVLADSNVYNTQDFAKTPIPALNIAYSGDMDGGVSSGLHLWCGPSKHFKTMFCLVSAAAYLDKYPEAYCVFYDNEFGSPKRYFESVGIDTKRVLHAPFTTLEELREDVVNMLKEIERGEKCIFIIDSLGMAASAKEVKDAEEGNEKADMTRAKVAASFSRIVLPHLRLKDVPMLAVQHTYQEMTSYPKTIVSGGQKLYLAADNVYILGRQQDKEGTAVVGYNFIINVDKSRYVREKSKIPVNVRAEEGLDKWSGMFDIAVEGGFITRLNNVSYGVTDPNTGEVIRDKLSRSAIENDNTFWKWLIENTTFNEYIKERFKQSHGLLIKDATDSYEDEEEVAYYEGDEFTSTE